MNKFLYYYNLLTSTKGGEGVVYDIGQGFLRKDLYGDAAELKTIENEVQMFKMIYGEHSAEQLGPKSMVMKKIPGVPLSSYDIRFLSPMDRGELISMIESLHKQGIHHGDLHRGNILFNPLGDIGKRFNLIDFGHSSVYYRRYWFGYYFSLSETAALRSEMDNFRIAVNSYWPPPYPPDPIII